MDEKNYLLSRRSFISSLALTAGGLGLGRLAVVKKASAAVKESPSIGLALGSGGATGIAHVLMLEVLDELGVKPSVVAGSSIGAVVGALYASGLSGREIRDIADEFAGSGFDVFKKLVVGDAGLKITDLVKLAIDEGGLLDSEGFLDFLKRKIKCFTFEELTFPLKIVAADYWSRGAVVFESGELIPAINASMAVPGLFPPVQIGGRLLVDGGMVNPLPYDLMVDEGDIVVAVDVSGISVPDGKDEPDPADSLFNSFQIMRESITREKMRCLKPDIYVKPNVEGVRMLHFHRVKEIFEEASPAADFLRERLERRLEMS
ncbi:MAG TPA: patatin-like phospholipase family protein [Deltaproteobacteria bacterium]|nr:patatin-like phospholipase family protein [Deltaproteobacteria bacterium]